MWTLDDAKLSLRRYIASTIEPLPVTPPAPQKRWTIRLSREQVRDEERPAGMIESGDLIRSGGSRVALQQGEVMESVPLTVTLWPEVQEPREARRRADRLAQHLYDLMRFGLEMEHSVTGRPVAGPERIPLWDYAETAVSGTAEERTGPEDPHDLLWADSYSARAIQDPDDPRRYAVILEVTVSWERAGRVTDTDAPVVTQMPATSVLLTGEVNP